MSSRPQYAVIYLTMMLCKLNAFVNTREPQTRPLRTRNVSFQTPPFISSRGSNLQKQTECSGETQCGRLSDHVTYRSSRRRERFCVTRDNAVGGFGWPGNSLNEINFTCIHPTDGTPLAVRTTQGDTSHCIADNLRFITITQEFMHSK